MSLVQISFMHGHFQYQLGLEQLIDELAVKGISCESVSDIKATLI